MQTHLLTPPTGTACPEPWKSPHSPAAVPVLLSLMLQSVQHLFGQLCPLPAHPLGLEQEQTQPCSTRATTPTPLSALVQSQTPGPAGQSGSSPLIKVLLVQLAEIQQGKQSTGIVLLPFTTAAFRSQSPPANCTRPKLGQEAPAKPVPQRAGVRCSHSHSS